MERTRQNLHQILKEICPNCYYVVPSKGMKYPCIKYHRDVDQTMYADDIKYLNMKRYILTLIDTNPDSEYEDKLLELPYCSIQRAPYVTDNLYHFTFNLYF